MKPSKRDGSGKSPGQVDPPPVIVAAVSPEATLPGPDASTVDSVKPDAIVSPESPPSQQEPPTPPQEPAPKRGRGRPPLTDAERLARGQGQWVRPGKDRKPTPDMRVAASPDADQRYKATAKMMVDTTTGGLAMILGSDWAVDKVEEQSFLVNSTYEYLRSIKAPDLPPGIVLLAAIAMYAFPRVMSPNFATRMQEIKAGFKKKREPNI